jgi:hypothetical protein
MRGPLVERHAHLIDIGMFVVDTGHTGHGVIQYAFGNCIRYFKLCETRSAGATQVMRRECADAVFRKGFQVARYHARDELRVARRIAVLGRHDIATAVGNAL